MASFPLCLIGEGVASAPNRAMHEAALRATGRTGSYDIVSVAPAQLPGVLRQLRGGRWRGANVAAPYKLALAPACDELRGDALVTGTVNTITVTEDGRLVGDNTEAVGFEMALGGQGLWPVAGSHALVVGAGGVAVAVVLALSRVPVQRTTVVARRITATRALIDRLAAAGAAGEVTVGLWDEVFLERVVAGADIVVNATSAGLAAMPFDPASLQASCTVADVRYRPRPVDLVAAATAAGRRSCDGADMLLHQAMLSFRCWTGDEDPPYDAARRALGAELGG